METDSLLLHGFAFSGFRSFTDLEGVPFAPLGKVNMIAGQNNAGKSNVLRFLRDLLSQTPQEPSNEFDRPQDVLPQDWAVRLRLFVPDARLPERLEDQRQVSDVRRVMQVLKSAPTISTQEGLEFRYRLMPREGLRNNSEHQWILDVGAPDRLAEHLRVNGIHAMHAVNLFTGKNYSSGGTAVQFAQELLAAIAPRATDFPPVRIIQAFRQIRPRKLDDESELGLFDGVGLVERLQQLESPREIGASRDEARAKYERINRFVQHILDDSSATLHIPYDASTVQVKRGASVLPLDSLGTGVHQVVMLAASATLLSGTLIGLEEPEVHLHPLLQRRLVRYLANETDNQYIIATHSAHLLDYEAGRVFHLTYGTHGSEVAPAGTPHQLARLCADLGYRPSDLLQSNAVIWVEGPSDRIYLRRWIKDLAPDLLEGIHYSIMFYGGGLLRHLSPEDPKDPGLSVQLHDEALNDFISLRQLNRHLAVVIDSDKTAARKHVNATKQRVKTAFESSEGPGHAWITDCYTIENYVPRELLERAAKAVHPKWTLLPDGGAWANPLRFENGRQPDKVALSRFVADNWPADGLKRSRLEGRIKALVDLIRSANGHPAQASN